jgi:hypothetical protein
MQGVSNRAGLNETVTQTPVYQGKPNLDFLCGVNIVLIVFMKALRLTSISRICRGGVLFSLLAISPSGFGQIGNPIEPEPIVGPMVRIISPANHAVFFAPVDIPILAYVVDSPHTTNVEFYAGTNDLGPGFKLGGIARPQAAATPDIVLPDRPITPIGDVYCLVWTNAPPGAYALTAVTEGTNFAGTANTFVSRTSAPVYITIFPRIPVTNGPSVVSIVATDPIAVVGTNSWIWPGQSNATPAWTNWPPPVAVPLTNWGPKDALFTVRRFGGETNAVTVSYSIGGTASNGVDYVQLPGFVTFPADRAYALIPIVPIDNGPPYVPKTVILTLTPDTNAPPEYILGIPRRAEVLILHEWLRPLPVLLSDGSYHFNAVGPDGAWFSVANSPDLLNWTPVCTNQVVEGAIDFLDPDATNNTQQFYRAAPQAIPPSQ